jgi:hypothetical protein
LVMGILLSIYWPWPNLVVTSVQTTSWDGSNKVVKSTIKNKCSLWNLFCRDAAAFLVYFDGEELPTSSNYRPQVSKSVAGLARGQSITMTADFTPLARIENNYLWNVRRIKVTADPKGEVTESSESDNARLRSVPFSSELPIITIATLGGTIVNEPKTAATMKVIDAVGGRSFLNAPVADYDGRAGIELRGQLSSTFCKKQYGVETWDAGNNDIEVSLLQLPPEEDWVLYGPYDDKSLIRNVFAYGLSNGIGRYAPRTKIVELFVKDPGLPGTGCPAAAADNYMGIYVLVEKIKRDVNRVNVTKLTAADNGEPAVTGGYLLKKDWADPGDAIFTTSTASGYGTPITYVYPDCKAAPGPCDATAQQKAWIEKYVNDFEAALKGTAFADPVNGYAKYIDVPSFVDYYLLQELLKNSDGFRGSTYMHKDRNAKLKMGPLWDMNFTMGNVGFASARPPEGWLVGTVGGQMKWWSRLLQDPAFAQKVIDRWQVLRAGPFKTSILHLTMDNLAQRLRFAQARNFDRWKILGTTVVGNPTPVDPNETYQDVVQQAKTWIAARTTWIDNNIGAILPP